MRTSITPATRLASLAAVSACLVTGAGAALAQTAPAARAVPQLQVDPFWPKPLPNNWLLGQVAGVAASIEEPELIERILAHRREWGEEGASTASLGARAPPQGSLF